MSLTLDRIVARCSGWIGRLSRARSTPARRLAGALGLATLCAVTLMIPVHGVTMWNVGDVFVGVGYPGASTGGRYVVYKDGLGNSNDGVVDAGEGYTTGCAFDQSSPSVDLWTTGFSTNLITQFSGTTHGIVSTINASAQTATPSAPGAACSPSRSTGLGSSMSAPSMARAASSNTTQ